MTTETTNAITVRANGQDIKLESLSDIPSRLVFTSPEEAIAYVSGISAVAGFGDLPQAIVGLAHDEEGNPTGELDPAIYDDSMQVAVAIIAEKDTGAKQMVPVGVAIYPTPNPEAVAQSDEGLKWIAKLVEKEANLIAMRALRKKDSNGQPVATFEEAAEAMPKSLAAYITPTREAASGIMATFEILWRDIKKLMGQKSRSWGIANFSKKELRRAMESASYASGTYPRIEKKGGDSSLLVFALNLGKVLAGKHKDEEGNPAPLDPAFFDNCLANRDKHAGFAIDDEDGELDLDDILADADATEQDDEDGEEVTAGTDAE